MQGFEIGVRICFLKMGADWGEGDWADRARWEETQYFASVRVPYFGRREAQNFASVLTPYFGQVRRASHPPPFLRFR